jgi:hypothetical protein
MAGGVEDRTTATGSRDGRARTEDDSFGQLVWLNFIALQAGLERMPDECPV